MEPRSTPSTSSWPGRRTWSDTQVPYLSLLAAIETPTRSRSSLKGCDPSPWFRTCANTWRVFLDVGRPALPSLTRTFTATDVVWVAAEIYRGAKAPASPVEVVTALGREGEPDAVWHVRETFPPSAFGVAQKVGVRVPLPIATLTPGAYRLRVTATLRAPARSSPRRPSRPGEASLTTHREMDITIEAR